MSQENVELARGWIDLWNRGERALPEDQICADVEVVSRFRPEPYRGSDGVQRWTAEIDEQFEDWRLAVHHWRDKGEAVVALGRIHLRGRSSAVEFDQDAGAIIEFREGRLRRLRLFASHHEALEAAGLSE